MVVVVVVVEVVPRPVDVTAERANAAPRPVGRWEAVQIAATVAVMSRFSSGSDS
jgi:hypothetical protein